MLFFEHSLLSIDKYQIKLKIQKTPFYEGCKASQLWTTPWKGWCCMVTILEQVLCIRRTIRY